MKTIEDRVSYTMNLKLIHTENPSARKNEEQFEKNKKMNEDKTVISLRPHSIFKTL